MAGAGMMNAEKSGVLNISKFNMHNIKLYLLCSGILSKKINIPTKFVLHSLFCDVPRA